MDDISFKNLYYVPTLSSKHILFCEISAISIQTLRCLSSNFMPTARELSLKIILIKGKKTACVGDEKRGKADHGLKFILALVNSQQSRFKIAIMTNLRPRIG